MKDEYRMDILTDMAHAVVCDWSDGARGLIMTILQV